jgi:hypothetical protein
MYTADIRYKKSDAVLFVTAKKIMPFFKPFGGMADLFPVVPQEGLSCPP